MDQERKAGFTTILIGILISLAVLPFLSGYSKEKNIIQNLYQVGIALTGERQAHTARTGPPAAPEKKPLAHSFHDLMPTMIPFRFVLALSILFVFVGFVRLDRARRRDKEEDDPSQEDSSPEN
jgi:hypothetical protein